MFIAVLRILFFLFCILPIANGQIIFPENFVVLLDSSRTFKGSFSPEVKIQTQRDILIELSSVADLVFKIKNNSLTIAQKIEFTSIGGETALSGGYLYSKFKSNKNGRLLPEYFTQIQWADARGLGFKTAVGAHLRYAFYRIPRHGLFMGIGPFFEHERWNFNGVRDELLPLERDPISINVLKLSVYVSWKKWLGEKIFIDVSGYFQDRFDALFRAPRLASSTAISWQLSQYLQLSVQYQNIYDFNPIVPIRPWFHRYTTAFVVSF